MGKEVQKKLEEMKTDLEGSEAGGLHKYADPSPNDLLLLWKCHKTERFWCLLCYGVMV